MRILKFLMLVVVVLVVGIIALFLLLPDEKIAKIAADQVKAQTGRSLGFEGEVNFSFFPDLGVSTGPVTLSNAQWSDGGPMFQAQGATIGVDLLALLGGGIQVKDITLKSPNILLEKAKDGRVNWDLFAEPASETHGDAAHAETKEPQDHAAEPASGFTLDRLKISNAQLRYVDHAGSAYELKELDANLAWGGDKAEISLSVVPVSDQVELTATIANLNDLLVGDITEITAQIQSVGNKVVFDGRASIAPEIAGLLEAKLPKSAALMAALGLGQIDLPSADFKGDVTLTKAQLFSLRNGDLTLAGNALLAEADIDLAGKPNVTANIQAGDLDLSPFLASKDSTSETSSGWSTSRIDASALSLFDGSIALSASSIETGFLTFGASRLNVDIDRARAVATLHELNGYEGAVTGQFVVNNRNGLSVGGKMDLANLQLKELLTDLVDINRFAGQANANIAFLGAGDSVDAIMKSLKGDGSFNVGQGTISGVDLDKLFRGTPGGGTTVFDSMSANWTISAGILSNDDLRLELPSVLAKGAGVIGLGNQDIDYTLTPQLRNDTETGVAVPVRIKGPWSSPKIWPDLEAVINQNLAEEKKALEEKAKQAVADKLGVSPTEGQSIEKAVEEKIEKKLEEELGNALKNLLGGG
ncbi:AsmA family protein [Cognatishimia sp. WU-CL00825]|uniref:AsmA family protein n=1 Tax=Cognatishimia sp. WU-CL00825 TaxID=3127658 RepID=UPI003109EBF2